MKNYVTLVITLMLLFTACNNSLEKAYDLPVKLSDVEEIVGSETIDTEIFDLVFGRRIFSVDGEDYIRLTFRESEIKFEEKNSYIYAYKFDDKDAYVAKKVIKRDIKKAIKKAKEQVSKQ